MKEFAGKDAKDLKKALQGLREILKVKSEIDVKKSILKGVSIGFTFGLLFGGFSGVAGAIIGGIGGGVSSISETTKWEDRENFIGDLLAYW